MNAARLLTAAATAAALVGGIGVACAQNTSVNSSKVDRG